MTAQRTYVVDARTATPHFPGIGRYVTGLLPALAAQLAPGERLAILCMDDAQIAELQIYMKSWPSATYFVAPDSPFSLGQQRSVPRLLRRLPAPAVYHSPYYLMPYRPGIPAVATIHDLIPLLYPQTVSLRARLLFRIAVRLALCAADRVIAGAEASRRDLVRILGVDPARVAVTPYAADPNFHPRPPAEIERVRRRFALPDEYILYFGSNKPHKNLVTLVEAYATMAAETGARLVIAGYWDAAHPESQRCAEALGLGERVRFLGPVNETDAPALYSGATCFVFPSRYEGFGLPVLEAMACGAAVACSNTSSLPEVGGDAALYFDPEDVAAIARTLHALVADPGLRQAAAQKGLEQARRFSWSRTATQTLEVYRSLVD